MLITIALLCVSTNLVASQVMSLSSQSEYSTTSEIKNTLHWYWRSTTRFVTLRVLWDRTFYERTCLYSTFWAKFTTDRIVKPNLESIDDILVHIQRFDPDKKGIEELHVTFNGTINHDHVGSMACEITTEDGTNITKILSVDINISCKFDDTDDIIRYYCEPLKFGWLYGLVEAKLRLNNEEKAHISINGPGFKYLEYAYGSILSCYSGPGGPLIAITVMIPRVGEYELEIIFNSKYITRKRFEIR